MDNFFRRLKLYGIGFGIGLVCVFLFFRNRGCNWLPENRVKASIIERVIIVHEDEILAYKGLGITDVQLNKIIQNASVSFSESKKKGEPKAYKLTGELPNGKAINFILTLPDRSFVSELKIKPTKIGQVKNSIKGKGYPVLFQKNKELFYLGTDKEILSSLKTIGIIKSEQLLKLIKKNGYIDFANTTFNSEKSSHCWVIDQPINKFSIQTSWYKEKIALTSFDSETPKENR